MNVHNAHPLFRVSRAADRLCDALISTRPHDSNPDWGNSLLGVDVRFSNRPFGVKHFQTVHVAVC
jgi:hypothetical protein